MSVLFISRTRLTVNHICYKEGTWVDVLIATRKRGEAMGIVGMISCNTLPIISNKRAPRRWCDLLLMSREHWLLQTWGTRFWDELSFLSTFMFLRMKYRQVAPTASPMYGVVFLIYNNKTFELILFITHYEPYCFPYQYIVVSNYIFCS